MARTQLPPGFKVVSQQPAGLPEGFEVVQQPGQLPPFQPQAGVPIEQQAAEYWGAQEQPTTVGQMITGEGREAKETLGLPEFRGRVFRGVDPAVVARIMPVLQMTTDPDEFAKIVSENAPQIGVITAKAPDGSLYPVLRNDETGEAEVVNKPGLTGMDVAQAVSLGAAYAPTGPKAGLVGKEALKSTAKRSAATGAAIETAQMTQGGEFDPIVPVLDAMFGPAGEVIGAMIKPLRSRSPQVRGAAEQEIKQFITQRFKSSYGRNPTQKEMSSIVAALRNNDAEELARLTIPEISDPKQAERLAVFEAEQVPTTRGRITQEPADIERELRLQRAQSEGPAAKALHQARAQESAAIEAAIRRQMDDLGVPETAGEQVKQSLLDLQSDVANRRREAYRQLGELAGDAEQIPLSLQPTEDRRGISGAVVDALHGEIPTDQDVRRAIASASARFGVIGDIAEASEKGLEWSIPYRGGTVTTTRQPQQLNFSNFEEFRKALNKILPKDTTGAVKQIIRELDYELDAMAEALGESVGSQALEKAKEARKLFREEQLLFENKNLIQLLTGVKKGSTTPQVYSSQTVDQIMKPSRAVEEIEQLVDVMKNGGPKTKDALRSLQSNAINDLLEKSFSTDSQRAAGEQLFNHVQFSRNFDKNYDKLKVLFKDEPEKLKSLENIREIAKLMTKDLSVVGSDTARNLAAELRKLPGFMSKFGQAGDFMIGAISMATDYGKQVKQAKQVGAESLKQTKPIRAVEKKIRSDLEGYPKLAALYTYGMSPIGRAETSRWVSQKIEDRPGKKTTGAQR